MQGVQVFGGVCGQSDDGPGTHQCPYPFDRKVALAGMDSMHGGPCCPGGQEDVDPVIHQNVGRMPDSFSSTQDQFVQVGGARTFFADLDDPHPARYGRPGSLHHSPAPA